MTQTERRDILASGLVEAVRKGGFTLSYQPQYSLINGNMIGGEALIRWNHDKLGTVPPVEFIPLAEEIGVISEVGDWVFDRVIASAVKLPALQKNGFHLSINVSPMDFSRHGATEKRINRVHNAGVPDGNIILEITEGVLMSENPLVADQIKKIRDSSIGIAIDDFGTGFSSFAYIKTYDIDYLKLDRSFVTDLAVDYRSVTIIKAIVSMAHSLGIAVIAEGVETEAQLKILTQLGCDYGQGYLFGRPMPEEEFFSRVRSQERPAYHHVAV